MAAAVVRSTIERVQRLLQRQPRRTQPTLDAVAVALLLLLFHQLQQKALWMRLLWRSCCSCSTSSSRKRSKLMASRRAVSAFSLKQARIAGIRSSLSPACRDRSSSAAESVFIALRSS